MIDPTFADLMHYLDRPVPALMREEALNRPAGLRFHYQAEQTRRALENVEATIATWIQEGEKLISGVIDDCTRDPADEDDLVRLHDLLARLEAGVERDAKDFAREQKINRRAVKIIRSNSAAEGRVAAGYARRYLVALAARGRAKAELAFAISSLIAQVRPSTPVSPVFEDSKALGDYLRAATA